MGRTGWVGTTHKASQGKTGGRKGGGKAARWKSQKTDFPTALGNPAKCAGFPLSHRPGDCWRLTKPDTSLATKSGHLHLLTTLLDQDFGRYANKLSTKQNVPESV